jgi:hypothetical protein
VVVTHSMPISTIPVKWLKGPSNNYTSRFEVIKDERRGYETERCQQALDCYDYETTTNKDHPLTPSQALVAQLAERRFRNPSLHYYLKEGRGGEGAETLGRGFKSHLGLLFSFLFSF